MGRAAPRSRRFRRLARRSIGVAAAGGAVVAGAAGCGPTYSYLTSTSTQTYLAVPHAWTTWNQTSIQRMSGASGRFPFLAAFDANRSPMLSDNLSATPEPWGVVRVRDLASNERGTYSFDSLGNELFPLDQLASQGAAQVLGASKALVHGSNRGIRQVVSVQSGSGPPVDVEQVGYVNAATTRAWTLMVGCSAVCFRRNHGTIGRIVASWTVDGH